MLREIGARLLPGLVALAALAVGCVYGEAYRPIDAWRGVQSSTSADWSQRLTQLEDRATEEHSMVVAIVDDAKASIITEVRKEVREAKMLLLASLTAWPTTVVPEPQPKIHKPVPPPVRKRPQQAPKTSTAKAKASTPGIFR